MDRWSRRLSLLFFGGLLVISLLSNLNSQGLTLGTLVFSLAIIAGVFLRWRSIRSFKRSWQEIQGAPIFQATLDSSYAFADLGLDRREEETGILELTRGLCRQLNITSFVPNVVRWLPRIPSDHCEFGVFDADEIDLPRTLKGRLGVEQWKPVLASALVYDFKLARERFLGLAARVLSVLALLIFFVFSAAVAFSEMFSLLIRVVAGVLSLFFVILPIVLSQWLSARYRQKLRLKADIVATETVGTRGLVEALTKVKGLGLADFERREVGGWKSRFSSVPSTSRRIRNLKS